jgi:5-methyltetrahydropteroyltriglutamate--homocysteine methyltransferase
MSRFSPPGAASLDLAKKAISTIAQAVSIPVCLHACGKFSHIIDEFLKMPVQILDFEGSVNAANLASFFWKELQNRYIGMELLIRLHQYLSRWRM